MKHGFLWPALGGAAILLVALLVIAGAMAASGAFDVAADSPHSALGFRLLHYVRTRSVAVRAADVKVPPLTDPAMLVEGMEHYDAMCTGCHLAPGMRENEMRPGMNPKPPVLYRMPRGNPAEQFWIVKHGIKMTGMPAWGTTHTDEEIWDIVALLQKLPTLSPAHYRALAAKAGHHHDDESMDTRMDVHMNGHMDMSQAPHDHK
jgi:mono/diheme cytochrome c family protein